MMTSNDELIIQKTILSDKVYGKSTSAFHRYQDFFVGSRSFADFATYELLTTLLGPMPGAIGLALRKALYPRLLKSCGAGVVWGRNIGIRHPHKIEIDNNVAIDDECLLDAQESGSEGIRIGTGVLIARAAMIQCKGGPIFIDDQAVIASQSYLGSVGGIHIGKCVMISGKCYIGGGRYRTDDLSKPMLEQLAYSKGKLVIEDDVWIGAGAIIQDGVRVGHGSVIGAGSIIRENVPPLTMVVPQQRLVNLPRA